MTKRPTLRSSLSAEPDEAAQAAAIARTLRDEATAPEPSEVPMTTATFHLPVELLEALERAAIRRRDARRRGDTKGRGGRPSVSEIVRDLLYRHRRLSISCRAGEPLSRSCRLVRLGLGRRRLAKTWTLVRNHCDPTTINCCADKYDDPF
jgi:hypothetical protein